MLVENVYLLTISIYIYILLYIYILIYIYIYMYMIWTDGEDSLNTFLEHCNKQNKHIKFKPTGTGTTVPFLDVSVTLENGKLHSDLYCKPTDKHQYLYYTSCHPKDTKIAYHIALLYAYAVFVRQNTFSHYVPTK